MLRALRHRDFGLLWLAPGVPDPERTPLPDGKARLGSVS
jgi:hypothetical protein